MKTIFFDGAFGTYYNKITGVTTNCEWANLDDGETVEKIHKEYLSAGATAIKTNTFGVNSLLTDEEGKITQLIEKGYALAKKAVQGTEAVVFADIGYLNMAPQLAQEEYIKLSQLFLNLGAKHFLFETLSELDPLLPALSHIKKQCPDAFIITSFAVSQDGYTSRGNYYQELIGRGHVNPDIDVVGLNCVCGPSHLYQLIKTIDVKNIPFSAMPNGGYPSTLNGRTIFEDNSAYFSEKLYDIYSLGVPIVGGCCGTTPDHIRLSVQKIKNGITPIPLSPSPVKKAAPEAESHSFIQSFATSKKVIAVELNPPVDSDASFILSASLQAKKKGADIITITDSPLARTRADSFMVSAKIKREIDIEVLPHLCCRDKNHIGMKASLIGGHIENIRNILVITGDPVTQSERDRNRGVFSYNSLDLISFISSLNQGIFTGHPYSIAGALNVNVPNFNAELSRALKKIENGASVLLTQPIFTQTGIQNLQKAHSLLPCKLMAGIMPVGGYKNACFLNNEVSGIDIPDSVVQSLQGKSPEEVLQISADYSMEMIIQTAPYCDGYYLMTPLKRIDIICELIDRIRKMDEI